MTIHIWRSRKTLLLLVYCIFRKAVGIVAWYNRRKTWVQKAKGLTHEVAHIIGMRHDFTSSTFFIKRNRKCITNAPKWRGPSYFMEYKQAPWSWSTCSNEDFCRYFQKIEKNNGQFCLRPWFILNKMSPEFFENSSRILISHYFRKPLKLLLGASI